MLNEFLKKNIKSQAAYVEYGYGQVEPNHLSAQRNGQIYAQLPAAKEITVLEQGQFAKYDYAADRGNGSYGEVNFKGKGEWMLVFNEIKLYRDELPDCAFALVKDDYQARIYAPSNGRDNLDAQSRYYNGKDADGNTSITVNENTYAYDDVTRGNDPFDPYYNEDPFHIVSKNEVEKLGAGYAMFPRLMKTMPGDIFTTNTIAETELAVGDVLTPNANGILSKTDDDSADMKWQVVKVYTMPDHQKGVKIMRIA